MALLVPTCSKFGPSLIVNMIPYRFPMSSRSGIGGSTVGIALLQTGKGLLEMIPVANWMCYILGPSYACILASWSIVEIRPP